MEEEPSDKVLGEKPPQAGLMRSRTAHGSSRFRGVSWSARSGKWRAQMWRGPKVLHLGFFDKELDAAHAYDNAVAAHRASGAPANFVGPGAEEETWQECPPGLEAQ